MNELESFLLEIEPVLFSSAAPRQHAWASLLLQRVRLAARRDTAAA